MKNLITLLLFTCSCLISQAQLTTDQIKTLVKKSVDSVRSEYKAADVLLVTRLNNQNNYAIALSKRVDSLQRRVKYLEDSVTVFSIDSGIYFLNDTLRTNLAPLYTAIDALTYKNTLTNADIELIKMYLDKLRKFYIQFPQ